MSRPPSVLTNAAAVPVFSVKGATASSSSYALRLAEHVERDVLELDAEVLGDHRAAGEYGDILEHRLAPVAEAGGLDRHDLEAAAQLVDDQRRKRLALDVLGDDEQRLARLHDRLEHRQQRLAEESFFSWMRI